MGWVWNRVKLMGCGKSLFYGDRDVLSIDNFGDEPRVRPNLNVKLFLSFFQFVLFLQVVPSVFSHLSAGLKPCLHLDLFAHLNVH